MKKYNSKFYNYPIEVDDIWWEIIVTITTENKQKVIYSWYDIVEKTSYSPYINKCLLWSFIKHIPKNVLILWLWAWSFSKFLEDHIKNISITWVEIDETMLEIAKNEIFDAEAKKSIANSDLKDLGFQKVTYLIDGNEDYQAILNTLKEQKTNALLRAVVENQEAREITIYASRFGVWKDPTNTFRAKLNTFH